MSNLQQRFDNLCKVEPHPLNSVEIQIDFWTNTVVMHEYGTYNLKKAIYDQCNRLIEQPKVNSKWMFSITTLLLDFVHGLDLY